MAGRGNVLRRRDGAQEYKNAERYRPYILLLYQLNTPEASNLEAGRVTEVSLRGLGVVKSTMTNSAAGSTNGQFATVEEIPGPVAVLGSLIHYLWRVGGRIKVG